MVKERLRVVVSGYLGLLPAGGITWDYLQWPLGLKELGHDVFYLEDTAVWPIYQDDVADCSGNVQHLSGVMESFGLGQQWAYRDEASGRWFGRSPQEVEEICRGADLLINVSCSLVPRELYLQIPTRALVDTDPMFTQIQCENNIAFTPGDAGMRNLIAAHTHHFTFGEKAGAPDCRMPDCGVHWRPTRQPICLDHWQLSPLPPGSPRFTTVMNWTATDPIRYEGETWHQKDVEFMRYMDVPEQVAASFAVAVAQTGGTRGSFPAAAARAHNWVVLQPQEVVPDWRAYQSFIAASTAEFSVAKQTYVKGHTGWFSCRSACYLAAGRPVVTQDTGWSELLPNGTGLLAFTDRASAIDALRRVAAEPALHAHAAREIAEQCFDSRIVLGRMLKEAGL